MTVFMHFEERNDVLVVRRSQRVRSHRKKRATNLTVNDLKQYCGHKCEGLD